MDKTKSYLNSLPTWQKTNLELFRNLVLEVAPGTIEDWKWNVPVFVIDGKTFFAMSAFKAHTKFNFMQNGAILDDPKKLFNNGMESKKSRGIDLREGETINEVDLKELLRASIHE